MLVDLRVADPDALTRALDPEYHRRADLPDDTLAWFEHVVTDGQPRIRAGIELVGDLVRLEAISRVRFQRVRQTIRRLDPSATVVDESRKPVDALATMERLAHRSRPATGTPVDPATDPALAQAMADLIARHERAWLDDAIPPWADTRRAGARRIRRGGPI